MRSRKPASGFVLFGLLLSLALFRLAALPRSLGPAARSEATARSSAGDFPILTAHVGKLKRILVRPAAGILPYPYLIPSSPEISKELEQAIAEGRDIYSRRKEYGIPLGVYFQLFDWDSFFEGVAYAYDGRPDHLKSCVLNFLEFTAENGYTPRTIDPERLLYTPEQCKPFLAQGAYISAKVSKDFSWLAGQAYDRLEKFLGYWETYRRGPELLFKWMNGVESGVDNHPALLGLEDNSVEAVDASVYMYREYQAMRLIARRLGRDEEADSYRRKAELLREQINRHMWSDKDKIYYNIDTRRGEMIRIKSWTGLVPLWSDIPGPERAKALIETHVLNPEEFWLPYGIPSLAKDEAIYNQARKGLFGDYTRTVSNWQGPVWVVANYIVMNGLLNHGYQRQAMELAERIARLLEEDIKRTGRMHENYHAETGLGLWSPGFGSWNILAPHMLEEAKTGTSLTKLE